MMVKLWMRNFAQQNLNRFPPANGGYAGVRPTFKSCAPTKPCPQEKSPQVTAVLRCGKPRRRNAPILHFQLRSATLHRSSPATGLHLSHSVMSNWEMEGNYPEE